MSFSLSDRRARIVLALAFAAVLLFTACAAEQEDATADLTLDELGDMLLQPEDLPQGLSYESHPGLLPDRAPEGRLGGHRLGAYLPERPTEEGQLACITGSIELYESVGAAKAAWKEGEEQLQEALRALPYEGNQWRFEEISVPPLADQIMGLFLSTRANFCRWEDPQIESIGVALRKGRLWAGVVTYTLEHGASPGEAIALAQKQLARIEAALAEE